MISQIAEPWTATAQDLLVSSAQNRFPDALNQPAQAALEVQRSISHPGANPPGPSKSKGPPGSEVLWLRQFQSVGQRCPYLSVFMRV